MYSHPTYLRNTKQLGGVAQAPVAQLVTQDGDHLLGLALLDQGIIEDDVLLPGESVKVGVAVGAALATVDDVQLLQREVEFLGQLLHTRLERTGFERRQFVEHGQNNDRVDSDGEDLHEHTEEPEVVEERVAGFLDDLEHRADDRRAQNDAQELALDHIRNPQLRRLLVEPELLLEDEGAVVRDGERQDRRDEVESENEQKRLRDFALEPSGEIRRQQEPAGAPELGEKVTVDEREVLDLRVETGEETELGFGATVRLLIPKPHQQSSPNQMTKWIEGNLPDCDRRLPATLPPSTPAGAWCAAGPYTVGTTEVPPGQTGPGRIPRGHSSRGTVGGPADAPVAAAGEVGQLSYTSSHVHNRTFLRKRVDYLENIHDDTRSTTDNPCYAVCVNKGEGG